MQAPLTDKDLEDIRKVANAIGREVTFAHDYTEELRNLSNSIETAGGDIRLGLAALADAVKEAAP